MCTHVIVGSVKYAIDDMQFFLSRKYVRQEIEDKK